MAKSLVIVESPAKAKTINKYLGKDFVVRSSIGHIRDLPSGSGPSSDPKARAAQASRTRKMSPEEKKAHQAKKSTQQLISRMGVDPEHGWKARYEILPGKEKVIEELRKLAAEAEEVYLATDLDREGEAIAWHLTQVIGGKDSKFRRVVFNEITQKAIKAAFEDPGRLDMDRVNAQQARRFLDRVVGFMVSPLLWKKVARGLSAGRVQSVAVRLVVEREREIHAFVPDEYWELRADTLTPSGKSLLLEVKKRGDAAFRPVSAAEAEKAAKDLEKREFKVAQREDKPVRANPPAPFITSTLQQAASTRLGFSVKKTMMMAQRLYEAGHITYMRTDSTHLSEDAVRECRSFIEGNYGKEYLPNAPLSYANKESAQEAHEAIRPSNVSVLANQLTGMEQDAERLYAVIWQQFVACQMESALYNGTRIDVQAGDFELRARGRVMAFDGFTRVLPPQSAKDGDEDALLPDAKVGDVLKLKKLIPSQHFTSPPARFTEASLVKELEKRGIGRPSTYAAIISTIQDRGYVRLEKRRLYAEKMGGIVTDRLMESFSDLMDYNFTAEMEEELDEVAEAKREWTHLLDEFYKDFKKKLDKADKDSGGMRENNPVDIDLACPACSRAMQIRTASTGVFLGCSGYALPPKERCKSTINLVRSDEIADEDGDEAEARQLRAKRRCPICKTAMDAYLIDPSRKLHVCGNNPDCPGYEIETGAFKIKGYDGPVIVCDKCGSDMQLRTGRFGKYFACTNAEGCKNTRKLLRNGQAAPPKSDPVPMPELRCEKVDDFYLLRDGASGLFLAASQFPKNRETRAPKVEELLPHRGELNPKYHFILDAPTEDPDGRSAIVRYSRKSAEHYVQTEIDGKPSGWRAAFDGSKWVVSKAQTGDKPSAKGAAGKTPAKRSSAVAGKAAAPAKKSAQAKPASAKKAASAGTKKPAAKKAAATQKKTQKKIAAD